LVSLLFCHEQNLYSENNFYDITMALNLLHSKSSRTQGVPEENCHISEERTLG